MNKIYSWYIMPASRRNTRKSVKAPHTAPAGFRWVKLATNPPKWRLVKVKGGTRKHR